MEIISHIVSGLQDSMQTICIELEIGMQNIRIILGKKVRKLRQEMEWSQEELGERANLHPTYVGGIERGERNVSLENLSRLAAAFHLSLSELFEFPGQESAREAVESSIHLLLRKQEEQTLEFFLEFLKLFDEWLERPPQREEK